MTLVRFKQPELISRLANDAFFGNFFDSNLDNYNDCRQNTTLDYRINEEDAAVTLEFAVPGLTKADLEIEIDNKILCIKTKERQENDVKSGFASTEFNKTFRISDKINKDEISAHTENGVLYITLPMLESAQVKPARSIEIA